jgi:hypothetical protein
MQWLARARLQHAGWALKNGNSYMGLNDNLIIAG